MSPWPVFFGADELHVGASDFGAEKQKIGAISQGFASGLFPYHRRTKIVQLAGCPEGDQARQRPDRKG
jgi:hypothetical protein